MWNSILFSISPISKEIWFPEHPTKKSWHPYSQPICPPAYCAFPGPISPLWCSALFCFSKTGLELLFSCSEHCHSLIDFRLFLPIVPGVLVECYYKQRQSLRSQGTTSKRYIFYINSPAPLQWLPCEDLSSLWPQMNPKKFSLSGLLCKPARCSASKT